MNKKTLAKLEYNKIIDILIEQASSFGGKERCKRLKPMHPFRISSLHRTRPKLHLHVLSKKVVRPLEAVIRSANL